MKTLWENAYEDAQINCPEDEFPKTFEELREVYCNGYCSGAWRAIEILSFDPEYKNAVEMLKWKLGIREDNNNEDNINK